MKSSLVIALGSAALGAALVAGGVWAQSPQPMQPGQMQHGQMQPGQMPMDQMPQGQMPGGQMPHGQMPQGAMPHGDMSQGMHQMHHSMGGGSKQMGQGAFEALAEVVRSLEADSATDWSKVNMETLRQHLIDMDEVVLHASVKATQVPGGLSMDVTGTGRTAQSIRAMLIPHTAELDAMPAWSAKAEAIPDGVRMIVVARDPADAKTVARIRGLGFAGLLVQGGHHGPHHLAMAKGELPASHKH
ncbi:MAG TPA: hypothetical protein VF948_11375 [Methylomirabilota bacterium]